MATKINDIAMYNAWILTSNDKILYSFITEDDYIFLHGYDVDFFKPIQSLYTVTVSLIADNKTFNVSSRITSQPQNKINVAEIFGYRPKIVKIECSTKTLSETSINKILFAIK